MKAVRVALIALACCLPALASAQWMWIGKDGHKVFSDQAPPADIPAEKILRGPKGQQLAPASVPAAAAPAGNGAGAAVPTLTGKDNALQEKKKQLAAADAEKKKAEDAKYAAAKADNCNRARQARSTYQSGARIVTVDAKGERQYLDDNQRAAEVKRLDEIMARDCAQ